MEDGEHKAFHGLQPLKLTTAYIFPRQGALASGIVGALTAVW